MERLKNNEPKKFFEQKKKTVSYKMSVPKTQKKSIFFYFAQTLVWILITGDYFQINLTYPATLKGPGTLRNLFPIVIMLYVRP